jgi:hypothetical protein
VAMFQFIRVVGIGVPSHELELAYPDVDFSEAVYKSCLLFPRNVQRILSAHTTDSSTVRNHVDRMAACPRLTDVISF